MQNEWQTAQNTLVPYSSRAFILHIQHAFICNCYQRGPHKHTHTHTIPNRQRRVDFGPSVINA